MQVCIKVLSTLIRMYWKELNLQEGLFPQNMVQCEPQWDTPILSLSIMWQLVMKTVISRITKVRNFTVILFRYSVTFEKK